MTNGIDLGVRFASWSDNTTGNTKELAIGEADWRTDLGACLASCTGAYNLKIQ